MDVDLETLDPCPDIHALFRYYNDLYFDGKLGACSVQWSTGRMTMCAGVCCYQKYGGCIIKLSEPLLKFRPAKDLKETLLHEMIHAFIFLERIRDNGGHGDKFKAKMHFINDAKFPDAQRPPGGYNITVFHDFYDEVNLYRQHWWKCERCENVVKRAMNRPPQEADCRKYKIMDRECQDTRCAWHMHLKHCGGGYTKIKEPEGYGKKRLRSTKQKEGSKQKAGNESPKKQKPITSFWGDVKQENKVETEKKVEIEDKSNFEDGKRQGVFSGKAYFLGENPKAYFPGEGPGGIAISTQPSQSASPKPVGWMRYLNNANPLGPVRPGAPSVFKPPINTPQPTQKRKICDMVEDLVTPEDNRTSIANFVKRSAGGNVMEVNDRRKFGIKRIYDLDSQGKNGQVNEVGETVKNRVSSGDSPSVIDLISDEDDVNGMELDAMHKGVSNDDITCPGCGKQWRLGGITDVEFNNHLDTCVNC